MNNAKRKLAMILASSLAVSMVGCSGGSSSQTASTTAANDTTAASDTTAAASSGPREIVVGTWYEHFYTSDHTKIEDNPQETNLENAQMMLDNIRAIEKKYNITLHFENMTWEGVINSINTSILSGTPDADIYEADLQFAVPAVLNGYAEPISSYADADSDIFTDKTVMKSLTIGDSDESYLFTAQRLNAESYPLAFNMDMIKAAGLENPQDLYDKGEWTWDKWMEYMKALTVDKDGDGAIDVYGYGGWWTTLLNQMLMSNNTDIAATTTQHLDSPKTLEVLNFIQDMYVTEKVARPWNQDSWDDNCAVYADQLIAFWPSAAWVANSYGGSAEDFPFEIGYVPWPRGYSVEKDEAYPGYMQAGNWYFIPKNTPDPKTVYDVFYEWTDWYGDDTDLRDDVTWFEEQVFSPKAEDPERNFNYLIHMADKEGVDFWGSVKSADWAIGLNEIMDGTKTASQYVEENKQILQDQIDNFFN